MSELDGKKVLPEEPKASQAVPVENNENKAYLTKDLLAQMKKMIPIIFGLAGDDPNAIKERFLTQARNLVKNPGQFSEDFWDSLFGTGADGISREGDAQTKGKIDFTLELPEPVKMPDAYSVAYHRLDEKKKEIPHNPGSRLAGDFQPSAACKFLDLPPVSLRNLQATAD